MSSSSGLLIASTVCAAAAVAVLGCAAVDAVATPAAEALDQTAGVASELRLAVREELRPVLAKVDNIVGYVDTAAKVLVPAAAAAALAYLERLRAGRVQGRMLRELQNGRRRGGSTG